MGSERFDRCCVVISEGDRTLSLAVQGRWSDDQQPCCVDLSAKHWPDASSETLQPAMNRWWPLHRACVTAGHARTEHGRSGDTPGSKRHRHKHRPLPARLDRPPAAHVAVGAWMATGAGSPAATLPRVWGTAKRGGLKRNLRPAVTGAISALNTLCLLHENLESAARSGFLMTVLSGFWRSWRVGARAVRIRSRRSRKSSAGLPANDHLRHGPPAPNRGFTSTCTNNGVRTGAGSGGGGGRRCRGELDQARLIACLRRPAADGGEWIPDLLSHSV